MRPFRFAAGVRSTATRAEFVDAVREVEALGYSSMMLSDHLVDQLAPISALSVAAAVTSTLRLGTFVFNNDLRHPVVLAQELATLDRLSDGRLEIGIGAGWNKPEYEGAGIPYDPGTVRIDRLAESVAILKGLFADGSVDFSTGSRASRTCPVRSSARIRRSSSVVAAPSCCASPRRMRRSSASHLASARMGRRT